jgi:hypothetical protein
MATVSLKSQIAEVDRELALRRNVYNRETKPKKIAENELHMAHMRAVLGTLKWLDGNDVPSDLPRPGDLLAALVHIRKVLHEGTDATSDETRSEISRVVADVLTGIPLPKLEERR